MADSRPSADRMRMETPDGVDAGIERLAELFPSVITEAKGADGRLKRAVNFDMLRRLLSRDVAEGDDAYEFSWPGKRECILEAGRAVRKTLRPRPEESRSWDTTENLCLEGDNLDVLKLLQEGCLGRIKMIYVDPPYNTGNDFLYRDKFARSRKEHDKESGARAEDGGRLFRNTADGGRFHSDWCSMMYPRLMLARNLLRDDGVIFISIDDHEAANLKKMCDEIFGSENFVAQLCWRRRGGRQDSKHFAVVHEYVLCHAKRKSKFVAGEATKHGEMFPKYDERRRRRYKTQLLRKWGANSLRENRPNLFYPIVAPDGTALWPMIDKSTHGCWRWGRETMAEALEAGRVEFEKKDGSWIAYEKIYAPAPGEERMRKHPTWIDDIGNGTPELKALFGASPFDYPKSTDLVMLLLRMAGADGDAIILDFFSGSATTAHAVMKLNAEDGGRRRFIMAQLPEPCPPESAAAKAGCADICEIGRERIRRAGDRIMAELKEMRAPVADAAHASEPSAAPDIGFRVFRVDDSNMKDVFYGPAETRQDNLRDLVCNVKEDRTDLDLLFACVLEMRLPLTLPHSTEIIGGAVVHVCGHPSVDGADGPGLMACFDAGVGEDAIRRIAARRPLAAVFRDSSFADSSARSNVGEIFRLLSPGTSLKIL